MNVFERYPTYREVPKARIYATLLKLLEPKSTVWMICSREQAQAVIGTLYSNGILKESKLPDVWVTKDGAVIVHQDEADRNSILLVSAVVVDESLIDDESHRLSIARRIKK